MPFWNRSSENLAQIFHGIPVNSTVLLADRVSVIFAENIFTVIHKLGLRKFNEGNVLINEVVNELASLLNGQREKWRDWKKADVLKLLPDLVIATQWKLRIKGYVYNLDMTAELAGRGIDVLPALAQTLRAFKDDEPKLKRKILAEKHLHNSADYKEVSERALRCVVTKLRHPEQFRQSIFAWNSEYQLTLKHNVIRNYLFDQLALFAYMVKDDLNALPFDELTKLLRKHVEFQIGSLEKDQIAGDIVNNTFVAFLENKAKYIQKSFYVDKLLYAYFIDVINDRKEIREIRRRDKKIDHEKYPDDYSEPEKDESLTPVLEILRQCLKQQDKTCQNIIRSRFLSDYADKIPYDAVASLLNMEPRTVENRGPICNGLLKQCVIQKSTQQGLRPFYYG